jgi:hypothetical protein
LSAARCCAVGRRDEDFRVEVAISLLIIGASLATIKKRFDPPFATAPSGMEAARASPADKPIRLIDGRELLAVFATMNPLAPMVSTFTADHSAGGTAILGTPTPPICRACHVPMERRTARSGPHTGRPFWGCRNFPRCKVIVGAD